MSRALETCPHCGASLKKPRVWTDEKVEILKRFHAEGRSATSIGVEMGMSRGAVIGKLHRLGIKDADRPVRLRNGNAAGRDTRKRLGLPIRPRKGKPSAPRTFKVSRHANGFQRSSEKVSRKPKPKPELPAVVPVLGPVAFVDRPSNRCAWIDGDPKAQPIADLMVCGEAVKPGTNYCPHHHARLHDKYVLPAEAATYRERAA